jgi:hypothetical protein
MSLETGPGGLSFDSREHEEEMIDIYVDSFSSSVFIQTLPCYVLWPQGEVGGIVFIS